jgi:cell division septum initiation protein DivIVA
MFGISKAEFLSHEQRIMALEQFLETISLQNQRIDYLEKEVAELRQKNDELKSQLFPRLTRADVEKVIEQQLETLSLKIVKD